MPFVAENEIESLLMLAYKEPDARPRFVRALLDADAFVALFGEAPDTPLVEAGTNVLRAGIKLQQRTLTRNGVASVPFFSSPGRAWAMTRDNHVIAPTKVRDLFRLHPGAYFTLNPGSEFGKEFTPDEIADLLAGGIGSSPKPFVAKGGEKVLVGAPADVPQLLIKALAEAFRTMPEIEAAYLAQAVVAGREPGLMLEVKSSANRETLLGKVGPLIEKFAPPRRPIDMHVAARDEQLLSARIVRPFFVRKSGLRRLLPFLP